MRAVSDLHFHIGGKAYTFEPETVTTRSDLALLLPLFMALTQPRGTFDVEAYVDEYALWHCFRTVE
jgi:hypothetical protein